jgi:peptidoglycan/xylan/chitin deacetylase (PgdA/CDA1 family)
MLNCINSKKINYVLDHIQDNFDISTIKSRFVYLSDYKLVRNYNDCVIFLLSDKEYKIKDVTTIQDVPNLFPLNISKNGWYDFENSNLIFYHDLLKSSFFLLSGYQELIPSYKDIYNRFPYELSVQKELGITKKPIVNYYFEIIREGISKFCEMNGITCPASPKRSRFSFFLSHDVDKVDTYTLNELLYQVKVLFGVTKSPLSILQKMSKLKEYLINYLFTKKNPAWDFEFLIENERKRNIKSTFYFLSKDVKHHDAYYSFSEKRIKTLFNSLLVEGCEIGIHGTIGSATSFEKLSSNFAQLHKHSGIYSKGGRQHRLIYDINITPFLHEKIGLTYDSTLGFAEHEGFRNSYCLPFKLYNFKEERAFETWQIPLNVMDVTLYKYRQLDFEEAYNSILEIIKEIQKFNGIFSLLWHNGNFDEVLYPGITQFYLRILDLIKNEKAQSTTGYRLIKELGHVK